MKNNITVFIDNSFYGQNALAHAQKLAQIFDAEVNAILLNAKTNLRAVFCNSFAASPNLSCRPRA